MVGEPPVAQFAVVFCSTKQNALKSCITITEIAAKETLMREQITKLRNGETITVALF